MTSLDDHLAKKLYESILYLTFCIFIDCLLNTKHAELLVPCATRKANPFCITTCHWYIPHPTVPGKVVKLRLDLQ